ncbi:hypothetical protein [Gracilimonas sp.]|uniref:hypothetical protein n=1 Tax=Gracilimonas sp. TaxID=1974203 RepID=UPI0032EC8F82
MKNTIIWICGILIGGLAGYGVGLTQSSGLYFWVGVGIILGSTLAVTYNIHREEDDELLDDLEAQEIADVAGENKSRQSSNQKTAS